ncbi:hypothetical protein KSP39_PZI017290 [Platanthera zijinensis]|uniref:Uncharacterized protein n=1 Tax=Platanthera zijinensis TaxID=2320716 RepID=A0AAP0FZB2_9ASPA
MEYNDDEDDDFEGSGVDFSSNCCFDGDDFPVREKLNDPCRLTHNRRHCSNFLRIELPKTVYKHVSHPNSVVTVEHADETCASQLEVGLSGGFGGCPLVASPPCGWKALGRGPNGGPSDSSRLPDCQQDLGEGSTLGDITGGRGRHGLPLVRDSWPWYFERILREGVGISLPDTGLRERSRLVPAGESRRLRESQGIHRNPGLGKRLAQRDFPLSCKIGSVQRYVLE